jgi:enamine deaminase RidA (YjgF/YER057c/UK114 family)
VDAPEKDLQRRLRQRLEAIVSETESIFLRIGEGFPRLLSEMDTSLSAARDQITEAGGGSRSSGLLLGVIEESRDLAQEARGRFEDIHRRDKTITDALATGVESLQSLSRYSSTIKDDSEEMELISLNAMTVAVKAGKAGGAFSYITEELKRISERTIHYTDELTTTAREVTQVFDQLDTLVEELSSFQSYLFENFGAKLIDTFGEFSARLEEFLGFFAKLVEDSTNVRKPLMGIMEELQHQDIIRQSVDHVMTSLRELDNLDSAGDLDLVAFQARLPELARTVLEEVVERLEKNLATFEAYTSQIEEMISQSESRRRDLVGSDAGGAMERSYRDSVEVVGMYSADLKKHLFLKTQTIKKSREVNRELKRLAKGFNSFAALINRFHNITIASRIEVVKQDVLSGMTATVETMFDLTNDIETQMESAMRAIKALRRTFSDNMDLYEGTYRAEQLLVNGFVDDLDETYKKLDVVRNRAEESVREFSVFSGRFLDLFQSSHKDLDALQKLTEDIRDVIRQLEPLGRQTDERYRQELARQGLEDWKITDARLRDVIEGFTILQHKKAAAELAGFEVEDGAEEGEVTFF